MLSTCINKPRAGIRCQRSATPAPCSLRRHEALGYRTAARTAAAAAQLSSRTASRQRHIECRAEGETRGEDEEQQQQQTKLTEQVSKQTAETTNEGGKTLGFVGNLIMWSILALLMAASLFFTTARSFLPNDMQPLEEGIASEMR